MTQLLPFVHSSISAQRSVAAESFGMLFFFYHFNRVATTVRQWSDYLQHDDYSLDRIDDREVIAIVVAKSSNRPLVSRQGGRAS